MTLRNHPGLPIFVALGLLISACGGDDGGAEAASETGAETTEAGTSDEVGTEAGETADTTATTEAESSTDAETTDAESSTDAETTDAETTDAETTDAETTDAETGSMGCGDIEDPDACAAAAGCQSVNGSKLKENGPDSPCLEPSEFLGCIPEQVCGDALTWFCQGNSMFEVTDTCGPDGAEPCDGPDEPVDACP